MSFSKAPIRRFNDPSIAAKNQKGKIQKSQSGVQKRTLHSPRNLKDKTDNAEELMDLQPVEAEQPCEPPKTPEYRNEFLIDIERRFEEIPGKLCEVGRDAISNILSLVAWLSKIKKKYNMVAGDIEVLEHHIQQGDEVKTRWEEVKKQESVLMKEVMHMCAEKVLNLEKENTHLTQMSKQLEVTSEQVNSLKRLKDALEEKVKRSSEKMKVLEQRLSGEERKLKELLQQNSAIEKQLKLKEQHNDLKLMETQKSLETYTSTSQSQLCSLEHRVSELSDVVGKKEALIESLKKQLKTQKDELSLRLQTEMNSKTEESDRLKQVEQELVEKEEQIQTLSQDLCNLKQLLKRSMYVLLVKSRQHP